MHYGEEIRINQLATQVNMSEAHFRRVFEEYMNVSPGECINFIRIEKACD
ncbi:MAG: AraC family transcriptional regulator, partial [bacterium]|nr:AraC family transcriptional regulator [bacterium]